jgi:phage/plasmid-associated DNA primase
VKWENTFEGADQDQSLDDVLATEAPGILRWLVEGCLQWQEHGLDEPEKVVRDTLAYRQAEDVFARFQTDSGVVFRDDLDIQAGFLQTLLQEWADAEGISVQPGDVSDWLRENGADQKKQRRVEADGKRRQKRYWFGVGIPEAEHDSEQGYAR